MRPDDDGLHFLVGGGVASLSAAAFLIRNAGVPGSRIRIFEHRSVLGGSLDGSGDPENGYLTRGGRMFEENFVCTFDLLDSIPSSDDPSVSAKADILAFNRQVRSSSNCRLVRDGRKAADRNKLQLRARDITDISLLIATGESRLEARTIDSWFQPQFFGTNFWIMWATMFSFQPWHSLAEMRRYLRRFMHLFPGFATLSGILRTRYNQYDSIVAPLNQWLAARGVGFETGVTIGDVEIEGDDGRRCVTRLLLEGGGSVEVRPRDRVYMTLGSMTDASRTGSGSSAPSLEDAEGPAWRLWRRLAARYEGLGRPEVFCGDTDRTAWNSFTVTVHHPAFFDFMESFTGNVTGTGGLVTFAGSGWTLSIVMFNQPHFRDQAQGRFVFWGFGLSGDREGDFVKKPMWRADGQEIVEELAGHLRLDGAQRAWFEKAVVIPCRMPFITSQFMPRRAGDRPPVRPLGSENFAILGQFCEMPRDCVFTVEYSVRSAWTAVHELTGCGGPPPPVRRTDLDPIVVLRAAKVMLLG